MVSDDLLERFRRYREDPWAFACDCVFTLDPQDQKNPIKPFPKDLEYLRLYFKVWMKERLVGVPKSRRLFMSWSNIVLYLWDTMFHMGRHNAFVSKKEDDADNLIERAKFILEHIPEDKIPKELIPKWDKTFCMLEFSETSSKIQAFPSGSDQLRAYGFSGILNDEMAFQEDAKQMYASTFPTIENGGRFTAISSPKKGFFEQLVFDTIEASPRRATIKSILPGVEMWRNLGNQFFIFQAHYTADPRKRDPNYIGPIKAAMPIAQFRQEFELVWESFEGKPVYPDYSRDAHGCRNLQPHIGLPLLMGIDQGLMPAAVVCQLQGETLAVLREYTAENMGAERFSAYVRDQLRIEFPEWSRLDEDYIIGMDPTGFNRRDVDERSYADEWRKRGFKPKPGENLWEKRRSAVEQWLVKFRKGQACFKVNLDKCCILAEGFEGGYRYPDHAFEVEPTKIKPVKDKYSQPHDALQYVLTLLSKTQSVKKGSIPGPKYAWSRDAERAELRSATGH